jgi:hypothetical protein
VETIRATVKSSSVNEDHFLVQIETLVSSLRDRNPTAPSVDQLNFPYRALKPDYADVFRAEGAITVIDDRRAHSESENTLCCGEGCTAPPRMSTEVPAGQ